MNGKNSSSAKNSMTSYLTGGARRELCGRSRRRTPSSVSETVTLAGGRTSERFKVMPTWALGARDRNRRSGLLVGAAHPVATADQLCTGSLVRRMADDTIADHA
jgi:hypothetical protein